MGELTKTPEGQQRIDKTHLRVTEAAAEQIEHAERNGPDALGGLKEKTTRPFLRV